MLNDDDDSGRRRQRLVQRQDIDLIFLRLGNGYGLSLTALAALLIRQAQTERLI